MTVVDSQSVRATWEDPLDPNGIILSFSLSLQLTPGQDYLLPLPTQTEFLLSSDTFERDIAGLHPFARYEFSLRAATSFGEGSVTNSFATTNEAGTAHVDSYAFEHSLEYIIQVEKSFLQNERGI